MHNAGDFTLSPKARNHLAVAINDFRLRVDDAAAHSFSAAERILFGIDRLVVGVNGILENLRIDAELLGEFLNRVGNVERAFLTGGFVFRAFGVLLQFESIGIHNCPSSQLRLIQHFISQYVTTGVFMNEALAVR